MTPYSAHEFHVNKRKMFLLYMRNDDLIASFDTNESGKVSIPLFAFHAKFTTAYLLEFLPMELNDRDCEEKLLVTAVVSFSWPDILGTRLDIRAEI